MLQLTCNFPAVVLQKFILCQLFRLALLQADGAAGESLVISEFIAFYARALKMQTKAHSIFHETSSDQSVFCKIRKQSGAFQRFFSFTKTSLITLVNLTNTSVLPIVNISSAQKELFLNNEHLKMK